jgi:predicted DNA-binding transcriptional regulator AlpA
LIITKTFPTTEIIRTMPEFLSIDDLALILGYPVQTLRYWRKTGKGPRSAKIGKRILYRRAEVEAWINAAFENETILSGYK